MSHIDDLIAELCPDGVELKQADSVFQTVSTATKKLPKSRIQPVGRFPVFTQSSRDEPDGFSDDEALLIENVPLILFGDHTNYVKWVDSPFIPGADGVKLLKARDERTLLSRFLYHVLRREAANLQTGYARHFSQLRKIAVPVPPLEVQRAIVDVLDTFTKLEAELEAELEARKSQFEHYRALLIRRHHPNAAPARLGDIATISTGSRNTRDAEPGGQYAFYARGRDPLTLSEYDFDETAIITSGDGVGVGKVFHFAHGKYALHQRAYRIVPSESVDARFLYHLLVSEFRDYLAKTSVHASVTSLRKPMFVEFPVALPELREQNRLARILDSFESLSSNLSFGLPAEIAARRKQYEHYRDRLLTFKELER